MNFKIFAKKLALVMALAALLITSTAFQCGSTEASINKAAEASARFPVALRTVVLEVEKAFNAGTIDFATKERWVGFLRPMVQGNRRFIELVEAANNVYVANGKNAGAPAVQTEFFTLYNFFRAELLTPFINLLNDLKVINGETAQGLILAISAVRLILVTINKGFKPKSAAEAEIPKVQTAFALPMFDFSGREARFV